MKNEIKSPEKIWDDPIPIYDVPSIDDEQQVHTLWGLAKIKYGYFKLNTNESIHRKIYESYHNIRLDPKTHIHHLNGDKLNNSVENLIAVSPIEHRRLHKKMKIKKDKQFQYIGDKFPRLLINYKGEYVYLYKYSSINHKTPRIGEITDNSLESLKKTVMSKGLSWELSDKYCEYDDFYFTNPDDL